MEKFDKTRVLVPLNTVLYVASLVMAAFLPGWGNLALAAMTIVTIAVMMLVIRRRVEVYQTTSWEQMAPKLVLPTVILIIVALAHVAGAVIGASLHSDELQRAFAYTPIGIAIMISVPYFVEKYKKYYWG